MLVRLFKEAIEKAFPDLVWYYDFGKLMYRIFYSSHDFILTYESQEALKVEFKDGKDYELFILCGEHPSENVWRIFAEEIEAHGKTPL